jgi:hypothetical protein
MDQTSIPLSTNKARVDDFVVSSVCVIDRYERYYNEHHVPSIPLSNAALE